GGRPAATPRISPPSSGAGRTPGPEPGRRRPGERALAGPGDLAGVDAGRADVHPLAVPADQGVDRLDVRVPAPVGPAVGVAELLGEVRLLPADLAGGWHVSDVSRTPEDGSRTPDPAPSQTFLAFLVRFFYALILG